MKKLLKNGGRIVSEHIIGILSSIMALAALVIYFTHLPENAVQHVAFWVTPIMLMPLLSADNRNDEGYVNFLFILVSAHTLILAVLWTFPISIVWSMIPISLCYVSWLFTSIKEADFDPLFIALIVILLAGLFTSSMATRELNKRDQYIETHPGEIVVLKHIEKKSPDTVFAYIEGKGVFQFDNYVIEPWRLNSGDTVKIVIYKDKITVCEH